MTNKIDHTGKKYGRLLVVKEALQVKPKQIRWECLCECGNIVIVLSGNLKRGHTQSCGCLQKENTASASITHGHNRVGKTTPEYRAWTHMKTRCYNQKCDMYYAYGGRGIVVCERWLHSFENFLFDMGKRPSRKHSLDRFPDINGNYEPSNCRWATPEEQAANKRNNHWIEYNGRKMILEDWAKELNTTTTIIRRRLKRGHNIDHNNKSKIVLDTATGIFYDSAKEAAKYSSYNYNTFISYIKKGVIKNFIYV